LIVTAWHVVRDHICKLVYVRLVRTLGMLWVHKSSKFQYWMGGGRECPDSKPTRLCSYSLMLLA
jgi:hypothetical protein